MLNYNVQLSGPWWARDPASHTHFFLFACLFVFIWIIPTWMIPSVTSLSSVSGAQNGHYCPKPQAQTRSVEFISKTLVIKQSHFKFACLCGSLSQKIVKSSRFYSLNLNLVKVKPSNILSRLWCSTKQCRKQVQILLGWTLYKNTNV